MGEPGPRGWAVEHFDESPSSFHARVPPDPAVRAAWVCRPTVPALVLGSTQSAAVADAAACARRGIEVVRRRSGGGAVLVVPGDLLWVDLLLPAGDPLWEDDVGRAAHWVGAAWARALASLGVETSVHQGSLVRTPWSDLVCFAGLGPGEVTTSGGAKVVGVSQRRTRAVARFQCAALLRWDVELLVEVLALDAAARPEAAAALAGAGEGLPAEAGALLTALVDQLP